MRVWIGNDDQWNALVERDRCDLVVRVQMTGVWWSWGMPGWQTGLADCDADGALIVWNEVRQ